jgi:glycosyltransferase involved in cell wall biosynthesis
MDGTHEIDVGLSMSSKAQEGRLADAKGAPALERLGDPVLSFVIPALNEERFIARTIAAIQDLVAPGSFEIIVVDNGSTDDTVRIASDLGATVIHQAEGTIGSMRNRGVASAVGDIVVFLDADVVITPEWAARLPVSLERLREEPRTITGFQCSVSDDASWLERSWFAPREAKSSHVGSGHMLIARTFFNELDGFDETLATGEDYNLSRRAVERGGRIAPDDGLRAMHLGFPRSAAAFLQRESWHGIGDFKSLGAFVRSKVALSAAAFVALHVLLLISLLSGALWAGVAAAAGVVSLCLASSYHQYRSQPLRLILVNTLTFWIYYLGRSLALLRRITGQYARGSR